MMQTPEFYWAKYSIKSDSDRNITEALFKNAIRQAQEDAVKECSKIGGKYQDSCEDDILELLDKMF